MSDDLYVRATAMAPYALLPTATANLDSSVAAGIVIFAFGIIVGFICVFAVDYRMRAQMERDYRTWIAMGQPERRVGERRGKTFRRPR